jgi:hypothetical protein
VLRLIRQAARQTRSFSDIRRPPKTLRLISARERERKREREKKKRERKRERERERERKKARSKVRNAIAAWKVTNQ